MKMLDKMIVGAKVKAQVLKDSLMRKDNGDSQLVVALVLIAVAVGLCIIFKGQIQSIMSTLFNNTGTSINQLSKNL